MPSGERDTLPACLLAGLFRLLLCLCPAPLPVHLPLLELLVRRHPGLFVLPT